MALVKCKECGLQGNKLLKSPVWAHRCGSAFLAAVAAIAFTPQDADARRRGGRSSSHIHLSYTHKEAPVKGANRRTTPTNEWADGSKATAGLQCYTDARGRTYALTPAGKRNYNGC